MTNEVEDPRVSLKRFFYGRCPTISIDIHKQQKTLERILTGAGVLELKNQTILVPTGEDGKLSIRKGLKMVEILDDVNVAYIWKENVISEDQDLVEIDWDYHHETESNYPKTTVLRIAVKETFLDGFIAYLKGFLLSLDPNMENMYM
jgi:hypothetical protein